jgi:hypothetical protein
MKKSLTTKDSNKKSRFDDKVTKQGTTLKQATENFVRELKPLMEKFPLGINIRGVDVRTMIPRPGTQAFRQHCKKNGIRVMKVKDMDIYRFEIYDVVAEELKKHENTRMLRPDQHSDRNGTADEDDT